MTFNQYCKLKDLKFNTVVEKLKSKKESQEVKDRKTKPVIIPKTKNVQTK
jgi:hypothetical protein